MPRPLRPDVEDSWIHVMNRGIDHGAVFFDDSDRIEVGQRLADVYNRFGIRTHAYCLMDTHYHLLWHCPDGGLSDAMQRLGSLYTRHVNDRLGRDGALFRGRFHSRLIVDDAHFVATARYIHRNALDLPGVSRAQDYRWSSHRAYLGFRKAPPWLCVDRALDGWTPGAFDRFVDQPFGELANLDQHDLRRLIEATELVLAERGLSTERRLGAVARQLALAWLVDTEAVTSASLMDSLALERIGALRTAVSRARALVRDNPDLRQAQLRAVELLAAVPITSRV